MIKVVFRRGGLTCKARVVRDIKKGVTFMPFHFIERATSCQTDSSDSLYRMSEYKVAAIRIEKTGEQA
jgi:formate dehydrogenase (coenzyme F420) alpha subunit